MGLISSPRLRAFAHQNTMIVENIVILQHAAQRLEIIVVLNVKCLQSFPQNVIRQKALMLHGSHSIVCLVVSVVRVVTSWSVVSSVVKVWSRVGR